VSVLPSLETLVPYIALGGIPVLILVSMGLTNKNTRLRWLPLAVTIAACAATFAYFVDWKATFAPLPRTFHQIDFSVDDNGNVYCNGTLGSDDGNKTAVCMQRDAQ
jgi:hypothetical protein